MFVLVVKAIVVFQYIFYREKLVIRQKKSVLSQLKGNYTDNPACSLTIAIEPTILFFKLSIYN